MKTNISCLLFQEEEQEESKQLREEETNNKNQLAQTKQELTRSSNEVEHLSTQV